MLRASEWGWTEVALAPKSGLPKGEDNSMYFWDLGRSTHRNMSNTSANPLSARAREGHKMHLQVALHKTGGHYPPAAGAMTSAPHQPLAHLLHSLPVQSHLLGNNKHHLTASRRPGRQASVVKEEAVLGAGGTW